MLSLELEPHNWLELVRAYQRFGKEISEEYVNLLIRRGISMALTQGGMPAVNSFWDSIQDKGVICDPCFHAFTDNAIQTGDLDNIVITNDYFVTRFLSHVQEKFGPSVLLPSVEVEGKVLVFKGCFNLWMCDTKSSHSSLYHGFVFHFFQPKAHQ